MKSRSALILSGSIGQGHDSVARACAAALAPGFDAEVLDCMALLGGLGDAVGTAAFRALLGAPALYDAFHFSVLRRGGPLCEAMAERSARRLTAAIAAHESTADASLILSVFATGVRPLARLRARRTDLSAVVVCTDATAHRLWVEPGIDRYLVCSSIAEGTVRSYLPDAEVTVIPPPVRPEFFDAPPRASARRALGLPAEAPVVLLLGGAWGGGPLERVAEALVRDGNEVLVVAGHNRRLKRQLDALAQRLGAASRRLFAFAYRADMATCFAAADVVVTSPGQACHEARVVSRPLVVLDSVPGHGRENLLAELAKPATLAASPQPDAVVGAVRRALEGRAGKAEPWPVASAAEWAERLRGAIGPEAQRSG